MSPEASRPALRRRVSPWLAVSGLLLLIAIVGSLAWSANGRREGDAGAPPGGLRHANLTGASLLEATLNEVTFEGVTLTRTDLSNAQLRAVDFSWTTGSRARFRNACLRDTTWEGSDLTSVNFDGADLRGADFRGAILTIDSARDAVVDDTTRWGEIAVPGDLVRQDSGEPVCD